MPTKPFVAWAMCCTYKAASRSEIAWSGSRSSIILRPGTPRINALASARPWWSKPRNATTDVSAAGSWAHFFFLAASTRQTQPFVSSRRYTESPPFEAVPRRRRMLL